MRMPRFRFNVRGMMVAVAIGAIALGAVVARARERRIAFHAQAEARFLRAAADGEVQLATLRPMVLTLKFTYVFSDDSTRSF